MNGKSRRFRRQLKRSAGGFHPQLEALEHRLVPVSAGPLNHVLLLSVDGLHNADIFDPGLAPFLTNTLQLQGSGVTYTNAHTTSPSDSFPGTLSYLTGAGPGTTGVFYDDSYSRTLLPPGSSSNAPPGTEVTYFEAIDKNSALISGGGNFDASSINPSLLPIDPTTNQVVYPNQFLQVNTIFDVAHQAGLYTAFSDKHPAYQIANGTDPRAINDFFGPEINSTTGLLDNTTGKTINADNLLNAFAPEATGLSVAPGFDVTVFATNPNSSTTQPDSIAVDGIKVFVGYGNGVAKDGSDGKSSTIVEYDTAGNVLATFSVLGHNDGLKVDPSTHLLWALQNEDANPSLVIIDPVANTQTTYTINSVNHGGGFDDITFLGGKVYMSASNPTNNPNNDPAVVQVTLNGSTAQTTQVLAGNASALNLVTNTPVTLNLQDPDSMSTDNSGDLVLTSQADNELVTIHNPGAANQSVTVLPLSDAGNLLPGHGVDDTLFTPSSHGEILVTDKSGTIYQIRGGGVNSSLVLSAALDAGELGSLNTSTGLFTPIISGLGSPRGLAFVNAGPFADLSNYTLVDASTDPMGASDPNLINDTTHNLLLTEKYDDFKVQAILNEIKGLPSHTFFGSNHSQIPAIFGMNFQAVSVAEKYFGGGITLLPNGQEGSPSTILEAGMQHTDDSIGAITAALKSAGIWNSTLLVLTAKHGQTPRVGFAGLMNAGTLSGVLGNVGVTVAQATEDDVSLLWLQNQSQTVAAVAALQNFKATGTIDVFFKGVKMTLPASQVLKDILSGQGLVNAGLGNPATDSTTPDIVVTLQPGYIWVGNVNSKHKNAEHGGFSDDDTHIALIVSGGLAPSVQGSVVTEPVKTTQIAVTALDALGLNPKKLQGAVIEHTKKLPGLKFSSSGHSKAEQNGVLQNINHFIVIYQENWSFDGLYGLFPGAHGLKQAADAGTIPQVDKFGNPITTLPNPSTDPLVPGAAGLPVEPYNLAQFIPPSGLTSDIIHRFYHEQLQIDNGVLEPSTGSMDKFVTWSDNGSLVMSYFDATNLPEGQLAQQFTLDDNFFHAAYGGSFLNHQFLISAAAPQWNQPIPAGFQSSWDPTTQTLHDSNLTIDGKYDVNTTFALQGPHPAGIPANKLLDPINDNNPLLPNGQPDPTYTPTIGDRLDAAGISWRWYSGGWTNALEGNPDPLFQFHHQPFAYYANYAPFNADGTPNPQTDSLLNPDAHLQDETQFFTDLANGNLPAVSFIKPLGPDNEHPGYTDLLTGQQHVADIVHAVMNSPEWAHTAIIITYDENGGRWDHVSPPTRDQWGDGTRVPAIVISPFARQGFVDHQQHDTLSILATIEARFGLQPLNQADANASTLSVDFKKHSDDGGDDQGQHSGGDLSVGQSSGPSGHRQDLVRVAPDILLSAAAGQLPGKGQLSGPNFGSRTSANSVWSASTAWMNSAGNYAAGTASVLHAAGQQTKGDLGINWESGNFLKEVFGQNIVSPF
jgi:phospholipase C